MEQLRKTSEWLPQPSRSKDVDYYRKNHFPVIEISRQEAKSVPDGLSAGHQTLFQFAGHRGLAPRDIMTVYDIDFVLRNPFVEISKLTPGNMPDKSIDILKDAQKKGVQIGGFATNQPLEGHQAAKAVGWLRNYPTILDRLEENFPDTPIISAGKDWRFLWRRPKTSAESVVKLTEVIDRRPSGLYAFFGDRYEVDAEFWTKVQQLAPDKKNKFVFVKMPDPQIKLPGMSHYSYLIP